MPRQTEPNANNALGGLLQAMLPKSHIRSENTRAIAGHPGLRPDILITASDRAPVVVEAEYMPAATVEPEARERLGLEVAANGRIIEAHCAVLLLHHLAQLLGHLRGQGEGDGVGVPGLGGHGLSFLPFVVVRSGGACGPSS